MLVKLWSRMHCWSASPVIPVHWELEDAPPAELLSLALPGAEVPLLEGLLADELLPDELLPDALPPDELSPVALPLVAPPPTESLPLELLPALGLLRSVAPLP